ncbi:hypothetical protein [Streptomyces sp. NPDC059611]|uniref:hypothetical protein n=1 Tax=Streptomyces sp. NPDC059611 TaxID=3346884 RepID=UPI00369640E5
MNRREQFSRFLSERASGLVHQADWLYVALVLISGGSWFLPRTPWALSVSAVLGVLALGGLFVKFRHGAALCERCVVSFSINAPEHAERHTRRFWLYHRSPWAGGIVTLPLLAAPFLPAPWSGFAYLPTSIFLILTALLSSFHSSYWPWCPICGDGGGGGEPAGAPTPTGGHGQPMPVT